MAINRYGRSPLILPIYRLGSCFWHVDNGRSLLQNRKAIKEGEELKRLNFDPPKAEGAKKRKLT